MRIRGGHLAKALGKYLLASSPASRAALGMQILEILRRRRTTRGRRLRFTPDFADDAEASDFANRCRWYLSGTGVEVQLPGGFPLQTPPAAQPAYPSSSVAIVASRQPDPDVVAYWRMPRRRLPLAWGRNAYVVDPGFYLFTECSEWLKLRNLFTTSEDRQSLDAMSLRNFDRFVAETRGRSEAFLFTTGPSLDAARNRQYPDSSLRIVCNSIVKNRNLLEHLRPDVMTFADDVFHFGPSLYAAKFRDDFSQMMERFPQCYAFIPSYAHSLMFGHYPRLASRLIGVPFGNPAEWITPSVARLAVRSTENILTFLMMPVAAAVCKTIAIVGADGRRPDEDYFWKHSEKNQFGDLMWSVSQCHPSFFEDNDYRLYYQRHCDLLESQISWLEQSGYQVRSLTPSYIPALESRLAKELLTTPQPVKS